MLVLSRKINQSLMIGDDIEIVLLETKGDSAKIGIIAPRDVPVFRQEIYLAMKSENQLAATAPTNVQTASSLLKNVLSSRPSTPSSTSTPSSSVPASGSPAAPAAGSPPPAPPPP